MAQAYTSITAEDFAAFVGYSVEEAVKGKTELTQPSLFISIVTVIVYDKVIVFNLVVAQEVQWPSCNQKDTCY